MRCAACGARRLVLCVLMNYVRVLVLQLDYSPPILPSSARNNSLQRYLEQY